MLIMVTMSMKANQFETQCYYYCFKCSAPTCCHQLIHQLRNMQHVRVMPPGGDGAKQVPNYAIGQHHTLKFKSVDTFPAIAHALLEHDWPSTWPDGSIDEAKAVVMCYCSSLLLLLGTDCTSE